LHNRIIGPPKAIDAEEEIFFSEVAEQKRKLDAMKGCFDKN
jgi:hypothetical protein